MKTRAITVAIILGGFSAAISQEYDDVYFSKKDREPSVVQAVAQTHKKLKALDETTSLLQATDPAISMEGYTGRTINPDYQPGGVKVTTASYFSPNYQPTDVNGQLARNNYYTSNNNNYPYNNYYGRNSFYGNGFGNYYSPYSNFGYSPYGWDNGFGSPYGGFYSPYYGYGGMNSMYSSLAFGMGYGFGGGCYGGGYYGSYYPQTVVVVNNPDAHVNKVYSKRESRSNYAGTNTASTRGTAVTTIDPTQGGRGGRVATASSTNTYYQRGWRQDPTVTQTSTSGSRSSAFTGGTSSGSRSTWGTNGGTTRTSNWGNSNSSFSPGGTRSNTSFGSGGSTFSGGSSGSRSSGFSGGGSSGGGSRPSGGGGGGSRGRN
jgi:hypothetical protein